MVMLKNISESLLAVWSESTPAARFGVILLTLVCCIMIAGVGYWSAQPNYIMLASDVSPEKMASIVDALEKVGISYEVGGAGGILRVDKRSFAKARLVLKGQGVSDAASTPEPGMGGMWLDPTDRKNLENRKKEVSLEASIKKYGAVESADVHLNIPARGPFERTVSEPSASVLLALVPGGKRLTDENILAIASLVAFAVQDLTPELVRITDKDGNVYLVPDEMAGNINSQIEFTTHFERKLKSKAESMLTKFLGYGNASVQVSVDMTFKHSENDIHEVDSEGKVLEEEELETTSSTKEDIDSPGAGVRANLATGQATNTTAEIRDKTEKIKSKYIVPTTRQTEVDNTPVRNYMTVAVLVNSNAPVLTEQGDSKPADLQQRVEEIVKTAVGFKDGPDKIWVEFQPFPEEELISESAAPFNWTQINELLRNASLAIAALVALTIGLMTLRRLQKQPAENPVQLANDQAASIEQLNKLAQANPEVFTKILQSWVGNQAQETEQEPVSRQAA